MIYRGTTTEIILKLLLYKTLSYKEVDRLIRKYDLCSSASDKSIQNTLYRLRKRNLVTKTKTGWSATELAKSVLLKRSGFNKNNLNLKNKRRSYIDQMIVMYDIPENLKRKRETLRAALRLLDFEQKQKSVWIGPAPLPIEFIDYLKELKIIEHINFFQVREKDII